MVFLPVFLKLLVKNVYSLYPLTTVHCAFKGTEATIKISPKIKSNLTHPYFKKPGSKCLIHAWSCHAAIMFYGSRNRPRRPTTSSVSVLEYGYNVLNRILELGGG